MKNNIMAKKKETYASKAKAIMAKYKKRLGDNYDKPDKLAMEAMTRELDDLRNKQEEARMRLNAPPQLGKEDLPTFGKGGSLNFKSGAAYKRWLGYVHATGLAERTPGHQEVSIKGKDKNVKHSYCYGGKLKKYGGGGGLGNKSGFNQGLIDYDSPLYGITGSAGIPLGDTLGYGDYRETTPADGLTPYKSGVSVLPLIGGLGAGLSGLLGAKNMPSFNYTPANINYTPIKAQTVTPSEIDLSEAIIAARRRGDIRSNTLKRSSKESSRGQGSAYFNQASSGITGSDRITGDEVGGLYTQENVTNAQMRQQANLTNTAAINQANAANSQMALNTALANERNKMMAAQIAYESSMAQHGAKQGAYSDMFQSLADYGRDLQNAGNYDNYLGMFGAANDYGVYNDPNYQPKWWQTILGMKNKPLWSKNTPFQGV